MALAAVFAANFYNGLNTHSWNWWVLAGVLIGPVLITLYTAVYSAFTPGFIWTYVLGNNSFLWPSVYFWLGMLFTILLSLLPRYLYRFYSENYYPSDIDILAYVAKRDPNQCVAPRSPPSLRRLTWFLLAAIGSTTPSCLRPPLVSRRRAAPSLPTRRLRSLTPPPVDQSPRARTRTSWVGSRRRRASRTTC